MSIKSLWYAAERVLRYSSKPLAAILFLGHDSTATLCVMAIAAAEVAIGLSLLLLIYRNRMNIDMDSFATIKW